MKLTGPAVRRLVRAKPALVALLLFMLVAAACASTPPPQALKISSPLPDHEALRYTLLDLQDHSIGDAMVSIERVGNNLVLTQEYHDLNQHTDVSSVTVNAGTMKPLHAERRVNAAPVNSTLQVTYQNGEVAAVANDGHEHKRTAKIAVDSYDDQESFFLLRTLDFSPGNVVHFSVVVEDAAKATISRALATARVVGISNISVGGKSFAAWQVQLSGAGAANTAWFDSGTGRRLLRYVNSGETSIELQNP